MARSGLTPLVLPASLAGTTTGSLQVPHGTAPSSPANGAVWTTTAGLYVRINGVTVGPLATGTGDALLGTVQTFTRQHSIIPSTAEVALILRHVSGASSAIEIQDDAGDLSTEVEDGLISVWDLPPGTDGSRILLAATGAGNPAMVLHARTATAGNTSSSGGSIGWETKRWTGAASSGEQVTLKGERGSSAVGDLYLTVNRRFNFQAASTTQASLRIPHTASPPSTPVDGDVWTTTAGMYVRINGVTVGPLGASSADMVLATQQTSTGRKIFSETTAVTPLVARESSTPGTYSFEVQNNAGTTKYLSMTPLVLTVGDSSVTTVSRITAEVNALPNSSYITLRPRNALVGDTGGVNSPSIVFYSKYYSGSSQEDIVQMRAYRQSGTATEHDLLLTGGGINVQPTVDRPAAVFCAGIASPTADVVRLRNYLDSVTLSSFNQYGQYVAPATATTNASARFPHGTAPTSPVNGDMWTTTAGLYVRINGATHAVSAIEPYVFSYAGAIGTVPYVGVSRIYLEGNYVVQTVRASVNTAPTGASILCDVNKNGTTIFTTQSARPTIAVSTFTALSGTPAITSFASGDYMTVDIDQKGSTVGGSDLTVVVRLLKLV